MTRIFHALVFVAVVAWWSCLPLESSSLPAEAPQSYSVSGTFRSQVATFTVRGPDLSLAPTELLGRPSGAEALGQQLSVTVGGIAEGVAIVDFWTEGGDVYFGAGTSVEFSEWGIRSVGTRRGSFAVVSLAPGSQHILEIISNAPVHMTINGLGVDDAEMVAIAAHGANAESVLGVVGLDSGEKGLAASVRAAIEKLIEDLKDPVKRATRATQMAAQALCKQAGEQLVEFFEGECEPLWSMAPGLWGCFASILTCAPTAYAPEPDFQYGGGGGSSTSPGSGGNGGGTCPSGDGLYCDGDTLRRCTAGSWSQGAYCQYGCVVARAGVNDYCAVGSSGSGGSSGGGGGSGCPFGSGLYCEGNTLKRCAAGVWSVVEYCGNGCVDAGAGNNDYCADSSCECGSDRDCAGGEYCDGCTCVYEDVPSCECSSDSQCASNEYCNGCACVYDGGSSCECNSDGQCGSDEYCDGCACIYDGGSSCECSGDGDCQSDEFCNGCACIYDGGSSCECSSDSECRSDEFCDGCACVYDGGSSCECSWDGECRSDEFCDGCACVYGGGSSCECSSDSDCAGGDYCDGCFCVYGGGGGGGFQCDEVVTPCNCAYPPTARPGAIGSGAPECPQGLVQWWYCDWDCGPGAPSWLEICYCE
jgi:hypothetical protein